MRRRDFLRAAAAVLMAPASSVGALSDSGGQLIEVVGTKITLFSLTIQGWTATEGLPLQGVYFDEVRRMELGDKLIGVSAQSPGSLEELNPG